NMPLPSLDAMAVLIDRFFQAWPDNPGTTGKAIAKQMGQTSFAEVFEFCQNIRRRHILSQGLESLRSIVAQELRLWTTRIRPDGESTGTSTSKTRRSRKDPAPHGRKGANPA